MKRKNKKSRMPPSTPEIVITYASPIINIVVNAATIVLAKTDSNKRNFALLFIEAMLV